MIRDLKALWSISKFRRLFIARTISNVGNGISPIALAFGVLSLEDSTPSSLSFVFASQMIPIVLFLIIGGVVADRFGRAFIVGAADMLGAMFVTISGVAFLSGHASVPLLCVTGFAFGVLNALWYPAFSGLMPEIVPGELLQSATSIVGFGANAGAMFGASIAAILVSAAGPGWAILSDAASFFIAGVLVFSLRPRAHEVSQQSITDANTTTPTAEPRHRTTIFADLREGWDEFSSRRWLVAVVASWSFHVMAMEGFIAVLAPVQMKENLGGARDMGLMMAGNGVGMLVGVLVAMRMRPKHPLRAALIGTPILPLWMVALAVPVSLPLLIVIAAAAGIVMDLFFVLWLTTLQREVPGDALSRVSSYDAMGSVLFTPIGLLLAGPLAEWLGVRAALVIAGIISFTSVATSFSFRDVRNLTSDGPNAATATTAAP